MEQRPLDQFSSVFLDAIKYREDNIRTMTSLIKSETEVCSYMRKELLDYVSKLFGVSTDTHDISINIAEKKVMFELRPQAEDSGPVQPIPKFQPSPPLNEHPPSYELELPQD